MSSINPIPCDGCSDRLTATENAMADLWKEVLQTARSITPEDDFFALGGDSMAMVTLEFRIQEALAVCLPGGAVLSAPTLRELSTMVDSLSASPASP